MTIRMKLILPQNQACVLEARLPFPSTWNYWKSDYQIVLSKKSLLNRLPLSCMSNYLDPFLQMRWVQDVAASGGSMAAKDRFFDSGG